MKIANADQPRPGIDVSTIAENRHLQRLRNRPAILRSRNRVAVRIKAIAVVAAKIVWAAESWLEIEGNCLMVFGESSFVAHAAKTRNLRAGSIVGSGTISNKDTKRGYCCIAEKRCLEIIEHGAAQTEFMKFGDSVKIEMFDEAGKSIFGAIDQLVAPLNESTR